MPAAAGFGIEANGQGGTGGTGGTADGAGLPTGGLPGAPVETAIGTGAVSTDVPAGASPAATVGLSLGNRISVAAPRAVRPWFAVATCG